MESTEIIKNAGLKITPQRKVVYEVMMELRHAAIDEIIKCVQSKDNEITISTIYRILDSFCKANLTMPWCSAKMTLCFMPFLMCMKSKASKTVIRKTK